MIRPIPAPPRRDQRGAAVISALIIVAIVAALTTSLFQRQTASVRRLENEQSRLQARMLLAGGIDWARLVVRDHGKREAVTRKDQIWATPILDTRIERPGDERVAVFSGGLEDEQGKYNLYNLARAGCRSRPRNRCCCGCWACCACRTRWRRASSTSWPWASRRRSPPKQPRPRPPARRRRAACRELGAALGLDPAVRDELQRTMTLLPANTQVNVNTAPPEVIAALAPGLSISQARAIAGERDRGNAFNNSGDFANRLAGAGFRARRPPSSPPAAGSWRAAWWSTNAPVSPRRRCCAPRPAPRPRPSG